MYVKKIFQLYNDLQKMYEKEFLKIRIHWKPLNTTVERVISIYLNQEQQKLLSRWDSLPGQAN